MSIVTLNDRGVRSVTTFGSLNTGSMVFIKKLTASSSSTLSFVNGTSDVVLDSTYKEYIFTFKNIHPATDQVQLKAGFRDGSTDYDAIKTTTAFYAYHKEDDSATALSYDTGADLAQSTGAQVVLSQMGNDNDQNSSGYLRLFNPSSTTFVKHFMSVMQTYHNADYSLQNPVAGYANTTSAIDAVQFKMDSGNIDAGTIKLYGIKDS